MRSAVARGQPCPPLGVRGGRGEALALHLHLHDFPRGADGLIRLHLEARRLYDLPRLGGHGGEGVEGPTPREFRHAGGEAGEAGVADPLAEGGDGVDGPEVAVGHGIRNLQGGGGGEHLPTPEGAGEVRGGEGVRGGGGGVHGFFWLGCWVRLRI